MASRVLFFIAFENGWFSDCSGAEAGQMGIEQVETPQKSMFLVRWDSDDSFEENSTPVVAGLRLISRLLKKFILTTSSEAVPNSLY